MGNHLFANAKALVFAGLFFEGAEADRWLAKGVSLLRREVPEQILSDGGHFERSPMYHCLILEDLLELVNLARAYGGRPGAPACLPLEEWQETASRMLSWLGAMRHPDGEIALFNDAAFGIAPSAADLEGYAVRLGLAPVASVEDGVAHLPESGYVRVQSGAATAILDVAPLGPDYIPGHGHADTLSFEFSVHGQRVLADPGTSTYEAGPLRLAQRGTRAHNTVVVDDRDSSEVWRSFRVARRAKPFDLSVESRSGETVVACSHDGYSRLPGKVTHRRMWTIGSSGMRIEDGLTGRYGRAQAGFLLHPSVAESSGLLNGSDEKIASGRLTLPSGGTLIWRLSSGEGRYEPATYHPEFGLSVDTVRLVTDIREGRGVIEFAWGAR